MKTTLVIAAFVDLGFVMIARLQLIMISLIVRMKTALPQGMKALWHVENAQGAEILRCVVALTLVKRSA